MRPIHYIIIVLMSSTMMCTKKVVIKVDPVHKRLVVHGFIAAGEYFRVSVARTTRTNFDDDYWRPEALVLLYSNNVLLDTLRYDDSTQQFFTKKVIAETNRPYTLKVSAPGYPSVEATDMASVVPPTESLEHRVKSRRNALGHELDEVIFSFRDPAQVTNHYLLALHPGEGWGSMFCVYATDPAVERTTSKLLPFDDDNCINSEFIFIPDKSFDGQLKTVNLSSNSHYFRPSRSDYRRRAYLKRYALNEPAYNYFKYTQTLEDRDELPFVTESTDSRSNVKEGYGLFAIYDVQVDSIY